MQEFGPEMGGGNDGIGGVPDNGGENSGQGPQESKNIFEISPEKEKQFQGQAAAVKQLLKEEKKSRKKDNKVADVILKFLQDTRYTRFFILIAKLVSRNVPSNFLLSLLALINQESSQAIKLQLGQGNIVNKNTIPALNAGQQTNPEQQNIIVQENFSKLPPSIKTQIEAWTNNIFLIGNTQPAKLIHTLINKNNTVSESFYQLGTFILQEFLNENGIENEYKDIRAYIQTVFRSFLLKYKKTIDQLKKIDTTKTKVNKKQ